MNFLDWERGVGIPVADIPPQSLNATILVSLRPWFTKGGEERNALDHLCNLIGLVAAGNG